MADEEQGHPKTAALTVNVGELEAAFREWDENYDPVDEGDNDPASKAQYFFTLLERGKGRKA